jgi:WD40 repeat protein
VKKGFAWFLLLLLGFVARAQGQAAAPLKLLQTIPLPGVPGALDHMRIDVQRQRLFIPAEQHQTVEVVDLRAGKRIRTISDVLWPSTVAWHPQSDEIFVIDREDGSVKVFSGDTYELVKTIKLIRISPELWVCGFRSFRCALVREQPSGEGHRNYDLNSFSTLTFDGSRSHFHLGDSRLPHRTC